MPTIEVALKSGTYQILVENGILHRAGDFIRAAGLDGHAAIITDANVSLHYSEIVRNSLASTGFDTSIHLIPPGEPSKSMEQTEFLCRSLIEHRHDRSSFVVALGGGVVGDVAGFVASIFYRGIPCVQIPTTIVAQVDSSIGGKTGVNTPEGKNLIGTFHQPRLVLVDPNTLLTLPERVFHEGFAEAIKHAAIRDAVHFAWLEAYVVAFMGLDLPAIEEAIAQSCTIKAAVVAADEREAGLRAILNFGHTVGHALEALTGYGALRHGEAVAIGMACAAALSIAVNDCPADDVRRLIALLERAGLPTPFSGLETAALLEQVRRDKKVEEQRLRLVLMDRIGQVSIAPDVAPDALAAAIESRRADTAQKRGGP